MAADPPRDEVVEDVSEADFQKALQELAKGERTATALENQLNVMEEKIEALLAQAEKEQVERQNMGVSKPASTGAGTANQK